MPKDETTKEDRETEPSENQEREREKEGGGETRERKLGRTSARNSRNVRTTPHDSSMKNSTELSPRPTVNNLGKFEAGFEAGPSRVPATERKSPTST